MNCLVCDRNNYRELDYGGYLYQGQRYPLVQCLNCGLKFIVHNLDQATLDEMYNQAAYFDSEYEGGAQRDYVANEEEIKGRARRALRFVKRYARGPKLLEIGSAGGYLLEVARDEFNIHPVGVELSRAMVAWGKNRGLPMYSNVDEIPANEKFDMLYMGDVLEHMPRPKEFISLMTSRLEPAGIVTLELPLTFNLSVSGIFIGIVQFIKGKRGYKYFLPAQHRKKFLPKPPYHLGMFNRQSIHQFFDELGYEIVLLRIYEGPPKDKFKGRGYRMLKIFGHFVTYYVFPFLGDRMFVIARKRL